MRAVIILLLAAFLTVPIGCVLTRRAKTETAIKLTDEPTKSLHQAAADGDIDQVKSLISKSADVNAKGNKGRTGLWLAKEKGHKEIVGLLRKHRAKDWWNMPRVTTQG